MFMLPAEAEFEQAVALLRAGELVAFPTETVYGLGANAADAGAVANIFTAKGRPANHPLIVHLPAADWVERWAHAVPQPAWDLMEAFWPGPLTLILKKQDWVPAAVTGGQDTVGLRIPGNPVALELLRRFAAEDVRGGIAAPSANRFGRVSPTTAAHVREELGGRVALVLDGGPCAVGIESTIVDLSRSEPVILRPGHIAPAHLAAVLGAEPAIETAVGAPRVSGSLPAHYAPATPLRMLPLPELARQLTARTAVLFHSSAALELISQTASCATRRLPGDPAGYAQGLYAALRSLDTCGATTILVERIPQTPDWAAVGDRLRRALAGAGQNPI